MGQADALLEKPPRYDRDSTFRKIDELLERWNNRLHIHNLIFAERYLKGELKIAILQRENIKIDFDVTGRPASYELSDDANGQLKYYVSILERATGSEISERRGGNAER